MSHKTTMVGLKYRPLYSNCTPFYNKSFLKKKLHIGFILTSRYIVPIIAHGDGSIYGSRW